MVRNPGLHIHGTGYLAVVCIPRSIEGEVHDNGRYIFLNSVATISMLTCAGIAVVRSLATLIIIITLITIILKIQQHSQPQHHNYHHQRKRRHGTVTIITK